MKVYVGNNQPTKHRPLQSAAEESYDAYSDVRKLAAKHKAAKDRCDLATFVGCVTITNPATGQHRTFRIRRQPDKAAFAPGQRIVSLLTGPDNESDFTGFGFVTEAGHICLWKKQRDSKTYIAFRNMLENPTRYEDSHGMQYAVEKRCRRCFRLLTDPISLAAGMGPECRQKA